MNLESTNVVNDFELACQVFFRGCLVVDSGLSSKFLGHLAQVLQVGGEGVVAFYSNELVHVRVVEVSRTDQRTNIRTSIDKTAVGSIHPIRVLLLNF